METEDQLPEIFIQEEPMEKDDPNTELVCRVNEGDGNVTFHKVFGVFPCERFSDRSDNKKALKTPEGFIRVIARKVYRVAFSSIGEQPEMYEKVKDVPNQSLIREIHPENGKDNKKPQSA